MAQWTYYLDNINRRPSSIVHVSPSDVLADGHFTATVNAPLVLKDLTYLRIVLFHGENEILAAEQLQ